MEMTVGLKYKWKHDSTILKYIGHNFSGNGYWHQFERFGEQGVWCEVLTPDLDMLELVSE